MAAHQLLLVIRPWEEMDGRDERVCMAGGTPPQVAELWDAAIPSAGSTGTAGGLLVIAGVVGSGVLLALLGGILAGAASALLSVRINPAVAIRKP